MSDTFLQYVWNGKSQEERQQLLKEIFSLIREARDLLKDSLDSGGTNYLSQLAFENLPPQLGSLICRSFDQEAHDFSYSVLQKKYEEIGLIICS